jgi:hypothetical protein
MCYNTFQEVGMLVTDIGRFFLYLVVIAVIGSAIGKDLCNSDIADTPVMQSDWGGCGQED